MRCYACTGVITSVCSIAPPTRATFVVLARTCPIRPRLRQPERGIVVDADFTFFCIRGAAPISAKLVTVSPRSKVVDTPIFVRFPSNCCSTLRPSRTKPRGTSPLILLSPLVLRQSAPICPKK